MHSKSLIAVGFIAALGLTACSQPEPAEQAAPAPQATAKPKLDIKPFGTEDPNFKPDYSKLPAELQKTFTYIDEHIDDHVESLQAFIRQPSISNSGEGIPETAEMVKGFYEELGCQTARVYDTGITEYGSPGNPVVYAKCDEGAEKTVAFYVMYDTMPVTQPDNWIAPPFEARIVERVARDPGARRHQLQGRRDGAAERAPVDEGGARQAAGQHHLRRRRR